MDVFGATLEVSVFKELDSNGVVDSDRCWTRLEETNFGCKFATWTTVVHHLSAKSTEDILTRG